MSAVWPSAVATLLQLLDAINNTKVTLAVDAGIGDTTLTVNDASPLQVSGFLTFDDNADNPETISYTGKSGNNLTGVTRAADGTAAGTHVAGSHLEMRWNAAYHNTLSAELRAIEQNLSDRFGLNTDIVIPTAVRFTPPKLTTTQRDALATPTDGLVIENTTTHVLNYYNGTNWLALVPVNVNGDIVLSTVAKGLIVTTPDGAHTVRIAAANMDADGNSAITTEVVS
jgi:hypothetical protein